VEAKKPSVNLRDEISPAYQLRRYGWSAKLPLSILSDFDEFAVYDCRVKPGRSDSPAIARTLYIEFEEYPERWEEIASIFSREAVLRGSFDRYAESTKAKKGTAEVDDAFLKEIEAWRDTLARTIALRNTELTQRELNFAVQRTIDRMIFLRICEDRGIETYGALMALLNGEHVYKRLCELFHRADEKYNSGLFHFRKEKDRLEEPDELTLSLSIDDKPLKEIIRNLYYPDSPYEFSVLPADILGQVYEQFLGKVIRLTAGHRAVVEDKPEVKKAGGVYYTPTYIVDYIVKNTVGALLNPQDRHPSLQSHPELVSGSKETDADTHGQRMPKPLNQVQGRHDGRSLTPKDASKLRILDPACGSGSFLIGAYQYLLDWHRDWYVNDGPKKWATGRSPVLYQVSENDWRLTTTERKRILLNNIYGVDIDPQAVEVTKLSLLLKVLEGENEQTISRQLKMFHERALPDLGSNIKCGNSLIGPDFYEGKQLSLMDDEERLRINVFDWKKEFSEIFKAVGPARRSPDGVDRDAGGFDAVIGNPPYGGEFSGAAIDYLKKQFETFVWRGESYLVFVERAINLLKVGGVFGYIIPDTYLNLGFTESLRRFLLHNTRIAEIVALPSSVFRRATVDTTLLFIVKAQHTTEFHESLALIKVFDKKSPIEDIGQPNREFTTSVRTWFEENSFNVRSDVNETRILSRVERNSVPLSEIAQMFSGIKAYEVGKGSPAQTEVVRDTKPFTSERKRNASWFPLYDGRHVGRYELLWARNNWINYGPWLAAPREPQNFLGEKILIRKIVGRTLIGTYVPDTSYCNTLLFVVKTKRGANVGYLYLLGILNSGFIGWYFRKKFQISEEDTFPQIMIRDILQFPIPTPDKSLHDRMVEMVEEMLTLHKQLASAKTEHEKTALQRQIDATDKQIDALVYELYELTQEEIEIVEGKRR
jgi:type I restriction-modification system DNA methylase subunit